MKIKVFNETEIPPLSTDDLILRSINLPLKLDDRLRVFAEKYHLNRSDIIRSAVSILLDELKDKDASFIVETLKSGQIGIKD